MTEAYAAFTVGYDAAQKHHLALCKRSPRAAAVLARRWEAVNTLAAPGSNPLKAPAILSMAFQRPTRLLMLLDNLAKATPTTHADWANLEQAVAALRQMCQEIEIALDEHERASEEVATARKQQSWTIRVKVESLKVGKTFRRKRWVALLTRLASEWQQTLTLSSPLYDSSRVGEMAVAGDVVVASLVANTPASPASETAALPTSPTPSEAFSLEDSFSLDGSSSDGEDGDDDEQPAVLIYQASTEMMSSVSSVETASSATGNALGLFGVDSVFVVNQSTSSDETVIERLEPKTVVLSAFEAEVERACEARRLALTGRLPGRTSRPRTFVCVILFCGDS